MMKLRKNKKALYTGINTLVLLIFLFSFSSLIAITAWKEVNTTIQSVPNETINQATKDKIDEKISPFMTVWPDRLFVFFFIALLISYLISATTIPAQSPVFFLVFTGLLLIITIITMVFSNAWVFMLEQPLLSTSASDVPFMTFVMKFFPLFTLAIGFAGAVIFYSRRSQSKEGGTIDF